MYVRFEQLLPTKSDGKLRLALADSIDDDKDEETDDQKRTEKYTYKYIRQEKVVNDHVLFYKIYFLLCYVNLKLN